MRTVLVFGTFDIVHEGHKYFLSEAKKHGEKLTVVLARDVTVEKVKGRKAHFSEKERKEHVLEVPDVNEVLLGSEGENKYESILELCPTVIALGYDQVLFTEKLQDFLSKNDLQTRVVRIDAYKPEEYKSSLLRPSS